jgi:hypothetical protein
MCKLIAYDHPRRDVSAKRLYQSSGKSIVGRIHEFGITIGMIILNLTTHLAIEIAIPLGEIL